MVTNGSIGLLIATNRPIAIEWSQMTVFDVLQVQCLVQLLLQGLLLLSQEQVQVDGQCSLSTRLARVVPLSHVLCPFGSRKLSTCPMFFVRLVRA